MLSGSTYFAPGTMGSASSKGMVDIELGLGGSERKHSKFTLLPAANPPRQDLYHFAPVFKVFRVSTISGAEVQWLILSYSQPLLRLFGSRRRHERECVGRRRPQIESNIPLEISLFLSGWVGAVVKCVSSLPSSRISLSPRSARPDLLSCPTVPNLHSRGTLPAPYVSVIFGSLNALQDW